jgi:hypothetical protein
MNGNLDIGSGSSSVAINKGISYGLALDVSGITQIRGNMIVSGTFTVTADSSFNGVLVGRGAGNVDTNTAMGYQALNSNTTGYENVAVGYQALRLNNGNSNIGFGTYALQNCTSGLNNTGIGFNALHRITTASHNVGIGRFAGSGDSTGTYNFQGDSNTFLGAYTGMNGSYYYSTAIGNGAIISANNQIVFGTSNENIFVTGGSASLNNAFGRSQLILKGDTLGNSFVLCNGRTGVLTSSLFGIVRESATTTTNIPFQINTSENIGIGYDNNNIPSTSGYKLFVNSGIQATQYNAISDYREKQNIIPLNEKYNVDVLNPVIYNLKSTGKKDVGFIAHEVQEFYPFLVTGEKDGPEKQSLNYNGFIGILTKEIQVLKKKVADQEAKALEQSTKALEQSTKALEQSTKALEQSAKIQALEKMVLDLMNK